MKNKLSDKINNDYSYIWMLIFWPAFGLLFSMEEKFIKLGSCHAVHCFLDDLIPFSEWFAVPYVLWFAYLIAAVFYTLFFDAGAFVKMMKFIMFTYLTSLFIYLIFPSCQMLRPQSFERDNFLTRFMAYYYSIDTNTNVCPSMHVLGSFAAFFAFTRGKTKHSAVFNASLAVFTALICISTVFVKQHSVLDILTALPLCALAYAFFFAKRDEECGAPKDISVRKKVFK